MRQTVVAALLLFAGVAPSSAGVIFNFAGSTLGGGSRWDAAPREINLGGTLYERSLDGGLRYSVQGGSYQAFRDLFSWSGAVPSVADFTLAVTEAFDAWTVPDPVTQLTTAIKFIPDFTTAVVGFNTGSGGLDPRGAEVDLFGSNDAGFWNPGNTGLQGEPASEVSAALSL
jgi:hypothetical protein